LCAAANTSATAGSRGCGGSGPHAARGRPGRVVAGDIPLGRAPGPVPPPHTTSVPSQRWRRCDRRSIAQVLRKGLYENHERAAQGSAGERDAGLASRGASTTRATSYQTDDRGIHWGCGREHCDVLCRVAQARPGLHGNDQPTAIRHGGGTDIQGGGHACLGWTPRSRCTCTKTRSRRSPRAPSRVVGRGVRNTSRHYPLPWGLVPFKPSSQSFCPGVKASSTFLLRSSFPSFLCSHLSPQESLGMRLQVALRTVTTESTEWSFVPCVRFALPYSMLRSLEDFDTGCTRAAWSGRCPGRCPIGLTAFLRDS